MWCIEHNRWGNTDGTIVSEALQMGYYCLLSIIYGVISTYSGWGNIDEYNMSKITSTRPTTHYLGGWGLRLGLELGLKPSMLSNSPLLSGSECSSSCSWVGSPCDLVPLRERKAAMVAQISLNLSQKYVGPRIETLGTRDLGLVGKATCVEAISDVRSDCHHQMEVQ